ncbi:MAG: hypothetical protein CSB13_10265 [Chloroflexi bacterium]|nr:MAG: hypothetical protein CSB13_10265 [Chloroflexota bacterium]
MQPMSNSTNTQENNTLQFNYGGQAVIEGVMMRGSRALAVAVRNPEGRIVVHTEPLSETIYGGRVARWPFVRGLTMLWDALGLGIKALMFSAKVALEEENEEGEEKEEPSKVFEGPMQWGTVLVSLSFSVLLFFVLPTLAARGLFAVLELTQYHVLENLIEGVIRLLLLIGYIWGISFMPDIKRLYRYHGSEHKTINAYEDGADLTPAIVAKYSLEHPRCGTAFLLSVVVISIIIYSLFPAMALPLRLASRLLLLPVIAGIAYEFLRFTADHQDNALVRLITKPNLAMQHLTTAEPDESMLEVAITAFNHVILYEQGEQDVPETAVLVEVPASSSAA